jgi:hypothetical protein
MTNSDIALSLVFFGFMTLFWGYKRLIQSYYRKLNKGVIEGVYEVLCYNFKEFDNKVKTPRNIETIGELQKRYVKKFIALRDRDFSSNIKDLIQDEERQYHIFKIYMSRRFWRCLEYTIAEIIINFAKVISKTKDSYVHLFYRNKIEHFIELYSKIYTNEYYKELSKESLYLRILQNICFINNRSTPEVLSIVSIVESEFMKHYVNVHKIFDKTYKSNNFDKNYGPNIDKLNIFTLRREGLEFWEPDLAVNLKRLQKLNFNIIDL